jgi:serine/threonine-protein kinase RsbW
MRASRAFPGNFTGMVGEAEAPAPSRDVALTIPAKPDYLVLARLALSAVCRLTTLGAEQVADLKLAVTEAANDFVPAEAAEDDESRITFAFRLLPDRLELELKGESGGPAGVEQELGRAIIDAVVDECTLEPGRTLLVKRLA